MIQADDEWLDGPFAAPVERLGKKRGRQRRTLRCPVALPKGYRFVIDSNEAAGNHLAYDLGEPSVVRKVHGPGDYTIETLEGAEFDGIVVVERKSFSNMLGEIVQGRERWEKSLSRTMDVRYPCVVFEGSLSKLLRGNYAHTRVHPNSVVGSLIAWSFRNRVPIWFAEDREHGQLLTKWILAKAAIDLRAENTS